jgi:hypothetical protein
MKKESMAVMWLEITKIAYKNQSALNDNLDGEYIKIAKRYVKKSRRFALPYELMYHTRQISRLTEEELIILRQEALTAIEQNHLSERWLIPWKQANREEEIANFIVMKLFILLIDFILSKVDETLKQCIELLNYLDCLSETYDYLKQHLCYWIARAGYAPENNASVTKQYLKRALQYKKKPTFDLTEKIMAFISEVERVK